ncbi:hypothetical protein SAMN05880590_10715 [Rhizobium sp. RU35A]|uniref:hypothetical protein n=1 Tax=Rhizobium sp. RU35A TaxID=1907414 RepID=UPI000953A592|nr:hypothetical protein [Rhizobium sp. RU35A]SIQ75445.1 hypothetical protein SAMN05880590_10715 [Rhizobium sp. RU35A]
MTIIPTRRNTVYAYDPLPEDTRADVTLVGKDMNGKPVRHLLLTQTIDKYQDAIRWAVEMADFMEGPIEIVTMTEAEFELRRERKLYAGMGILR